MLTKVESKQRMHNILFSFFFFSKFNVNENKCKFLYDSMLHNAFLSNYKLQNIGESFLTTYLFICSAVNGMLIEICIEIFRKFLMEYYEFFYIFVICL